MNLEQVNLKQIFGLFSFILMVFALILSSATITFAAEKVSYIDRTWDEKNKQMIVTEKTCTNYSTVKNKKTWKSGWYVLSEDVTVNKRIQIEGTVNLILKDGCTLTATKGIRVEKGNTLNIYAQSQGTGKLVATEDLPGQASIGGNACYSAGTITINGGIIEAKHDALFPRGAAIGGGSSGSGGTITINGGTVNANGRGTAHDDDEEGAYVGNAAAIGGGACGGNSGTIQINGGTVNATALGTGGAAIGGGRYGSGESITINGGTIDAWSTSGAAIGGGTTAGDSGTITINAGMVTARSYEGAAIGGGYNGGNGEKITIKGGTICAAFGVDSEGVTHHNMKGVAIGGTCYGEGGTIAIQGGTLECPNGYIGHDKEGSDATVQINGGNVKAPDGINGVLQNREKQDLTLQKIYLEGITSSATILNIVGLNDYGVTDMKTVDNNVLYIYRPQDAKITQVIVKNEEGDTLQYDAYGDGSFKVKQPITGVMAQDSVYDRSYQKGYTGMPKSQSGTGNYDITYYLASGEKTTPENSGAYGEGMAPEYAGDYLVKFLLSSSKQYYGTLTLEFTIQKATPIIHKIPELYGMYGTAVKDMDILGGIVLIDGEEIEGTWSITAPNSEDVPTVGTENSYQLTFTPNDTRNYEAVSVEVIPKVEPELIEELENQEFMDTQSNTQQSE